MAASRAGTSALRTCKPSVFKDPLEIKNTGKLTDVFTPCRYRPDKVSLVPGTIGNATASTVPLIDWEGNVELRYAYTLVASLVSTFRTRIWLSCVASTLAALTPSTLHGKRRASRSQQPGRPPQARVSTP